MPSIALNGHRPTKLDGYDLSTPFYARLRAELMRIATDAVTDDKGMVSLHSGMALGVDTVWAEVICAVRRDFPDRVRFVAHVPTPQQPDRWPAASQEHYRELLAAADEVRIYGNEYTPSVMQTRNRGMIDATQVLIAVYDGSGKGGAANAVAYARQIAKPMIYLHPDRFRK